MRKLLNCLFIFGLILSSCKEDKNIIPVCNVENPIEELDWLKKIKNSLTNCSCQISIFQGKYKENIVFFTMINDPLCNSFFNVILWDCSGNVVKEYKSGDNVTFYNEVELVKNIYTCSE